jgi:hypothetical protein
MNGEIRDQSIKINPTPQQVWERFQFQPSFQTFTQISKPLRDIVLLNAENTGTDPMIATQSIIRGLELSATMPEGTRYRGQPQVFEQRFQEWVSQGEYQEDTVRLGWVLGCLARGLCLDATDIAINGQDKSLDRYIPLFSQTRDTFTGSLSWIDFGQNLDRVMKNQGFTWNAKGNSFTAIKLI